MSQTTNQNSFSDEIIVVIGAGTMGHGIAGQAARCGAQVRLYDASSEALGRGKIHIEAIYKKAIAKSKMTAEDVEMALSRISYIDPEQNTLAQACKGASVVIEAAPERLELKRKIFAEVESVVDPNCLLASNTSSLSIDKIADVLNHPTRFIGMHFFNPVAIMPLLEIVRGQASSEQTVARTRFIGEALLKTPIVVKDAPGFATSRLGIALGNEAMRIYEEGVASAEDIDRAMVLGYRHPIGPLALTDLVGLDVRLAISEYLHEQLDTDTFKPPQILKDKVAKGELGKKTGRGFYEY
ncbi:MAG: 3-hydroxybutyryl-CoA dehydrogenase [Myxococcales bacterium]|nr:3-hydroxybutyryl-CoA dehydrogenase [Myxococcales bacterium]